MQRILVWSAAVVLLCGLQASAAVVNFDFEDLTDQGWGSGFGDDASETYPIDLVGGSNRMRVVRDSFQAAGRQSGNTGENFYQAMLAAASDEANYYISYDWYVDTSAGGYGTFLQLATYVNTGNGYYAQDFPAIKDVELNGTQLASGMTFSGTVTESFTAKGYDMDPTNTFYRMGLVINGNGATDTVHFDNVRIGPPVPEPASLALLGLAAPALLARRRRSTQA